LLPDTCYPDVSGNPVNGDTIYWTTTTSDGLGRAVSVTLPDGHQTTTAYSVENDTVNGAPWLGTQTTVTDPMGKQKRYLNDAFGNLLRVDEPNASGTLIETARYSYDAAGRMQTVGMRKNDGSYTQSRTFSYNSAGQLQSSTTPEKGTVTYAYYADGTLQNKTDAKNQTLWYAYDSNRRLLTVSLGANQSTAVAQAAFGYDSDPTSGYNAGYSSGRMTTASSSSGFTWHYTYDLMGRVSQQTLQTPFIATYANIFPSVVVTPSAGYSYDSDGKFTGMVYPGTIGFNWTLYREVWQPGTSYQTTYDAVGRATGLNAWDPVNYVWNPVTASAAYNAAGQITGWQEGAVALTRGYDAARGWMTTLTASAGYPYNQTYLNMQYGYNAGGQATSVTDSVNSGQAVTSYTYDNLNRLASATTPNWSVSWTYDEFGNRTSETGTGTAASLTSSLSYDQSTNRITTSGYGYDSNGNLTASPGKTYAYDAFDHLASGSYGAGNSYDAFGRRIARTLSDGSTQFYFYDIGGKLVQEYHFDPNTQCSVYGNLVPCPQLDGTPPVYTYFAGQRVGQWTDRTGSKRRDASSTSHYYPYGEEITSTNNDTFKFAQLYRDSDSGLDYAKNRYYASGIGRFLTTDPSGGSASVGDPGSWNRFVYVQSDPVNGIDPTGQARMSPGDLQAMAWCAPVSTEGLEPDPVRKLMDDCFDPYQPSQPPGGGGSICWIQLKYRGADAPLRRTHDYLWVGDKSGVPHVLEGDRQGVSLVARDTPNGIQKDNPTGDSEQGDGLRGITPDGRNVCDIVARMIAADHAFSPELYGWPLMNGPTSNSVTHWLLLKGQVDSFFTEPPGAWGWNIPINQ